MLVLVLVLLRQLHQLPVLQHHIQRLLLLLLLLLLGRLVQLRLVLARQH